MIILSKYYESLNDDRKKEKFELMEPKEEAETLHIGAYGERYNIEPKTYEGFDLVEKLIPNNSSGEYDNSLITVTYEYLRKTKVLVSIILFSFIFRSINDRVQKYILKSVTLKQIKNS